eukprot:scaffold245444_cov20-Tisochrysis_lutea.AAC.1
MMLRTSGGGASRFKAAGAPVTTHASPALLMKCTLHALCKACRCQGAAPVSPTHLNADEGHIVDGGKALHGWVVAAVCLRVRDHIAHPGACRQRQEDAKSDRSKKGSTGSIRKVRGMTGQIWEARAAASLQGHKQPQRSAGNERSKGASAHRGPPRK